MGLCDLPGMDLIVVVYGFHCGLAHPLHHQCVAEGDCEDRKEVGGYELVQDECSLMGFGREPLHAVLPRPIPVTLLYTLVY